MLKNFLKIVLITASCVPGIAIAGDSNAIDRGKLLQLVNEARAKGCKCGNTYYAPAAPVSWNDKLEKAARGHTDYMSTYNILSHTGENGSRAGERINKAGYKWSEYGENIAAGYKTEEEVINGWLNSSGHCKNLMKPITKHVAVARNGNYWTQILATGE